MVWNILSWLFFIVFIAGLIVVGGLLLKGYLAQDGGSSFAGGFFGPKPDKRLDVVGQANVDARRRLVLVRRDNVEHLIMTGGPVDVVIETNIEGRGSGSISPAGSGRLESTKLEAIDKKSPSIFNRPARAFGRTADEG